MTSEAPRHPCPSSPFPGTASDSASDEASSRDYGPDDLTRVTPVKRRRLLPLVDLRGGGMAGSSVELGGRGPGGSLGPGRRSRTPLTDLDAKFVTKSGLCASGDVIDGRGGPRITHLTGGVGQAVVDDEPRFPRLDQCAHFHYEYVELPPLQVSLVREELKPLSSGGGCSGGGEDAENRSLLVQVASLGRSWVLRRTYENFRFLDRQLHRCCYDRKVSRLPELPPEENLPGDDREAAVAGLLGEYVARLSEVAGSLITCGPVLNWLELDNRGHRLIVTDDSDINTPAVAAAYVIKRYIAQASDEISFEVGDMISVIDMPPPEESIWWRGKRGFQVGFFPCECVQVIGDKVPQTIQPQTLTLPPARTQPPIAASHQHHTIHAGTQAPTKPVLRKHGKLIAFFRSFILSRPSRRKLKQSGILRERVFGCDLGEHLLNSGHEIPMVLRCCSEFLESHGVVDGIYRLSGITSNIQKLRNAFDEDRIPDLYGDDSIVQDIHCVSSVLKMYFRELPNPLLTYQLYEKFVAAVMQDEDIRLLYLRDVVQQLPPPHYRTLEYLVQHLARVASHSAETGMTAKNIAIVWAPNLLRSKDLDMGGVAALQAAKKDVGTQAVVTEYLVRYVDLIFNDKIPTFSHSTNGVDGTPKKSRPKSLAISTPTKLISIEEARSRALTTAIKPDQKYIEVGGGPQNLPPKYHTVIELPSRKGGSLKQKKSPSGWKSIFSKGRSVHKHPRKASTPSDIHLNISDSVATETDNAPSSSKRLRPVKSVESLISTSASLHSNRNSQALESPEKREALIWEKYERSPQDERESRSSSLSSPIPSPRTHNRSVSHDSYFNTLESRSDNLPSQVPVKEEGESDIDFSPDNSRIYLDSELDLNFSTSEKDFKVFEADTLKSTSIEDPDNMSSSTLDMENLSMCSESGRSKENLSPRPEKKSLKEKFKHRFTSPPTQRKHDQSVSDSSEDSRNNSLKRASASLKDKIVHALSPETSRRRTETSPRPTSPSSSPKFKHVRTTETEPKDKDGQTLKLDTHSFKPEISSFLSGARLLPEHEKSRETVTAEVHVEAESQECDDTPSRISMDYTLIDPELLDKITHLRTSPSVSVSEVSSTSLAEATVSDNESFTLGSSSSGMGTVGNGREIFADIVSSFAPSSTLLTPIAPSVAIVALSSEIQECDPVTPNTPVTAVMPVQDDFIPQELPKPRPSSLLGLPTAELLNLGSALTSPETPQGDSTFLEIQYHPLSDTTEPSTPSESQFVQDLVGVGQPVPYTPAVEEPRQSSPLSIDLSSSDDPTEEGPMYENVDTCNSGYPLKVEDSPYDEPVPHSSSPSVQSSQTSFQTSEASGQTLLMESELTCADLGYENYNYNSVYENVQYGAEYENVEYGPEYLTQYEIENESQNETSIGEQSNEKYKIISASEGDVCYENVEIAEAHEGIIVESVYENVESPAKESLPVYENLEECSDEQDQIVPDTDDAYEEYSFRNQPNYENIEFSSQVSAASENAECDNKTEVEIEGEMVYQQVKFLRKSIQEVNDMLKVNEEKQHALEQLGGVTANDNESSTTAHTLSLSDNSSELPVQVPQMGNISVSHPHESLPCSQEFIPDSEASAADAEVYTQPSEDSECLDSPITPSSVSMATEVLVLPSFASPTESTTDDVTSPVSSDDASSPKPIQETDHCSSTCTLPPILPSLSPPTLENIPVPPAATSTPNRALPLPSIISPAPWPRTTPRHAPIVAPVPRPRQLPKLNLSSPLISPVSTPSSVSISPDSPATPGTPSSGSAQVTPTEENSSPQIFKPSQLPFNIHCQTESSPSFESKIHHNLGDIKSQVEYTEGGGSESELPPDPEYLDSQKLTERFKSSPDFGSISKDAKLSIVTQESAAKEAEDTTAIDIANILGNVNLMDPQKRERIEQYKKERRSFLREKYKSESFRGEKDEMIMRLKQKATSPSRPEDDSGENDDEIIQSSDTKCVSQRGRENSPSKQLQEGYSGKVSPVKQIGGMVTMEKLNMDSQVESDKGEQGSDSVFKRTSPARRSLSDMGRVGELKSPTRTRFSSGSSTPTFQKCSSTGSSSGGCSKSVEVTSPRSCLRRSPDKEILLRRSNSGDSKSSPLRKNSAPISPIKSPSGTPSFHRSASTRGSGRRKAGKDDIEDDINVKERVAIWTKNREKSPTLDKSEREPKIEKITIKQEQKSGMEMTTTRKSSTPIPLSPVRKTSIPKASPSSPGIPKVVPSSPGPSKSAPSPGIPKTTLPSPASAPKKISNIEESSSDASALTGTGNAAARGNSGQQRRIRDMAAIFERDSPSSAKPAVIRQSSREEKKERY
nr:GTPase-activating protein CdGAPr-like isoform X3 [Procambarus clarkii]